MAAPRSLFDLTKRRSVTLSSALVCVLRTTLAIYTSTSPEKALCVQMTRPMCIAAFSVTLMGSQVFFSLFVKKTTRDTTRRGRPVAIRVSASAVSASDTRSAQAHIECRGQESNRGRSENDDAPRSGLANRRRLLRRKRTRKRYRNIANWNHLTAMPLSASIRRNDANPEYFLVLKLSRI